MTAHSHPAVLPRALAATIVLAAAGCGDTPAQTPSSSSAEAPATSAASSPSPGEAATSATPTSAGTTTSTSGGCAVGALRIRYTDDRGGGGAGSVTGTFTFTNTGSAACMLTGFPGVSYVGGGKGTQIGQAATRTDGAVKTTTLAPGRSVRAALRRTQPGSYGDECQRASVEGFRVYPPGSTESAFVAFPTTGCSSADAPLLQIGPVR